MCRNMNEKAKMVKIMRHIRTIQKGTRMRFFQSTGCCDCFGAMSSTMCCGSVVVDFDRVEKAQPE